MKHTRMITWILVLALLLPCLPMTGHAAQELGVSVNVSPKTAVIGGLAEVTIALEGYDTAAFQGLLVNVTGIDPGVLEVMDYNTAIVETDGDDSLLSNVASHHADDKRVRLLYLRESGMLPASCKDVLKMTVRINPALTETGSITLPVEVETVTPEGQMNTLHAVCVIQYLAVEDNAVAYNSDTGATYETVGSALSAAKEGESIRLLADCAESLVVVPADVVLDLNGHVLTADNVVSFGAVIDTAETVGGIKIPFDTAEAFTKLQPENGGYLPIYDTADGMYKFFWYELRNVGAKASGNAVKFGIQIVFRNVEGYSVLANTTSSGVKLFTKLRWTGMTFSCLEYEIDAASIKTYGEKKAAEPGKNYAITLSISGLDNLSANAFVSAAPMISTTAEVGSEIDAFMYTVG